MAIGIFIAANKLVRFPRVPGYLPLLVGWDGGNVPGMLSDAEGENISRKNPYYCELTGLYWVWKNMDLPEVVGFCHYRRYFEIHPEERKHPSWEALERTIRLDGVETVLKTKDIILPSPIWLSCVEEQYATNNRREDLDVVKDIIREDFPECVPAMERVLGGQRLYTGNMMICRREFFTEYMEWLFHILFRAESRIQVPEDPYQRRVFGFLGERLLNIYVAYRNLAVWEMRVALLPPINTTSGDLRRKMPDGSVVAPTDTEGNTAVTEGRPSVLPPPQPPKPRPVAVPPGGDAVPAITKKGEAPMNILFIHPNYPAQFLHLAQYFANNGNHRVFFLTTNTSGNRIKNINIAIYKTGREGTKNIHPYVKPLEDAVLDGQAVARMLVALKNHANFTPDVIVAHTGWGSTLYVKDVYPDVPVVGYFEWYYRSVNSDVCWWPDEVVSPDSKMRIRTINAHHLMNLQVCDVRYTPTQWQKSQFPACYQEGMKVIHEGVDTQFCQPDYHKKLVLPAKNLDLSEAKEIVTYVSRGFEPYRGFDKFMDAIRILLKARPECHVVLVGSDRTCYGSKPEGNKTWKQIEEEKGGYDKDRVHFIGHLGREDYRTVMQSSHVHVYLTRPFVLSWSMIEAMSFGCCLVSSKTPPVEEVVVDGVNGLLANFRSPEHIAFRIGEALDDPALRRRLGEAARQTVRDRYDTQDRLREQINMIYGAMK